MYIHAYNQGYITCTVNVFDSMVTSAINAMLCVIIFQLCKIMLDNDFIYLLIDQVPLGVDFHNENKLDEMCCIMESLQKYVPQRSETSSITLPSGQTIPMDTTRFSPVLFGGDQLTTARARGARSLRLNHDDAIDRFEGIIPVVEDWHARVHLLEVRIDNLLYMQIHPI